MHRRTQIRNEAVTVLTGLPSTGTRVFNEQLFPLEQTQLPAWIVTTGDELVERVEMGGGQERQLELTIIGVARAQTGQQLKDRLETMLEEAEQVMLRPAFTALYELDLQDIEFEPDVEDNDQAAGALIVTYLATYDTTMGAPSAT